MMHVISSLHLTVTKKFTLDCKQESMDVTGKCTFAKFIWNRFIAQGTCNFNHHLSLIKKVQLSMVNVHTAVPGLLFWWWVWYPGGWGWGWGGDIVWCGGHFLLLDHAVPLCQVLSPQLLSAGFNLGAQICRCTTCYCKGKKYDLTQILIKTETLLSEVS